jgi:hypothetical protein
MPDILDRIVCAIMPFGASGRMIGETLNSNSIIGYDQYTLIRENCPGVRVELYDPAETYGDADVLPIMSTIWVQQF